jgi:hypothetical protein
MQARTYLIVGALGITACGAFWAWKQLGHHQVARLQNQVTEAAKVAFEKAGEAKVHEDAIAKRTPILEEDDREVEKAEETLASEASSRGTQPSIPGSVPAGADGRDALIAALRKDLEDTKAQLADERARGDAHSARADALQQEVQRLEVALQVSQAHEANWGLGVLFRTDGERGAWVEKDGAYLRYGIDVTRHALDNGQIDYRIGVRFGIRF